MQPVGSMHVQPQRRETGWLGIMGGACTRYLEAMDEHQEQRLLHRITPDNPEGTFPPFNIEYLYD